MKSPQNQPDPQSDELEEILSLLNARSTGYIPTTTMIKAKQSLEAWGRKQRLEELEWVKKQDVYQINNHDILPDMSVWVVKRDVIEDRKAELQGGKNETI